MHACVPACCVVCRTEYTAAPIVLGHGNFSVVYKATQKVSGMTYAIKTNREPINSVPARNFWVNVSHSWASSSSSTALL